MTEEPHPTDTQVVATAQQWSSIRGDPRFIELMRLARVANSLTLAYRPLLSSVHDQSPMARRERFAALFYAAALLKEGLSTAQSIGRWYRNTPQYRNGFAKIFKDPAISSLNSDLLDDVRNKLVFHFDRETIAAGLSRSPEADLYVLCSFPSPHALFGETYFDAADDIVLWYLFGDAATDDDYMQRLESFMEGVTDLLNDFLAASHPLIAIGLLQLGCRKRNIPRP